MSPFIPLGAVFVVVGLTLVGTGIHHHGERQPRHTAMLIGGMMATAFGLVIAGFAIAYQTAAPLDLNATSVPTP